MKRIYLIWDNTKTHKIAKLEKWIKCWNKKDGIKIKILLLPTYSPWLNPIEPIFSDLYQKVIAGSNFRWPSNMADAIYRYFRHRNKKIVTIQPCHILPQSTPRTLRIREIVIATPVIFSVISLSFSF